LAVQNRRGGRTGRRRGLWRRGTRRHRRSQHDLVERNRRIGEPREVQLDLLTDHSLARHELLRGVDGFHRDEPVVPRMKDRLLGRRQILAHGDGVGVEQKPRDLQLEVELI
jgi:hypothetical protein